MELGVTSYDLAGVYAGGLFVHHLMRLQAASLIPTLIRTPKRDDVEELLDKERKTRKKWAEHLDVPETCWEKIASERLASFNQQDREQHPNEELRLGDIILEQAERHLRSGGFVVGAAALLFRIQALWVKQLQDEQVSKAEEVAHQQKIIAAWSPKEIRKMDEMFDDVTASFDREGQPTDIGEIIGTEIETFLKRRGNTPPTLG